MNDVITKTFCNVVTGLAVCAGIILNLTWLGFIQIEAISVFLAERFDTTLITAVFLLSYLLGIVFNAFGLLFDKYLGNKICADIPSDAQIKAFWAGVEEHVLAYRDHVWSYYFCYRNLLILLIPVAVGCFGTLWCRGHTGWAFTAALFLLMLGIALFISVRELLALYFRITKSFA